MQKDFSVKSFVEEYEKIPKASTTEAEKFLRSKLKTEKYLPYADKVSAADYIVVSSSYAIVKDGDELVQTDVIKVTSPMRYVLFVMTVIDKYTNIEVNFKDNIMSEFDALNSNGLIEVIFSKIGDKEVAEFNTVLGMVADDFMANKFEFKNYVSEIVSKFADVAGKSIPLIDKIVNKLDNLTEEDEKKLSGFIGKISKFIK